MGCVNVSSMERQMDLKKFSSNEEEEENFQYMTLNKICDIQFVIVSHLNIKLNIILHG